MKTLTNKFTNALGIAGIVGALSFLPMKDVQGQTQNNQYEAKEGSEGYILLGNINTNTNDLGSSVLKNLNGNLIENMCQIKVNEEYILLMSDFLKKEITRSSNDCIKSHYDFNAKRDLESDVPQFSKVLVKEILNMGDCAYAFVRVQNIPKKD